MRIADSLLAAFCTIAVFGVCTYLILGNDGSGQHVFMALAFAANATAIAALFLTIGILSKFSHLIVLSGHPFLPAVALFIALYGAINFAVGRMLVWTWDQIFGR